VGWSCAGPIGVRRIAAATVLSSGPLSARALCACGPAVPWAPSRERSAWRRSVAGRRTDAEGHLEHAVELAERMEARPWVAHARHDHARLLLREGSSSDRRRAGDLLEAAVGGYRELDMHRWADSAAALVA
jgi:hypothetical protein